MPPRSDDTPVSSLGFKPHPTRAKSGEEWLDNKRKTDNLEGYWRVEDKLYDLTNFIKKHPGGSQWIELSKGTDITEAYEIHHLTNLPDEILKKYYVKPISTKRNSPFTFKNDGFYRTLKREVKEVLKIIPKEAVRTSSIFTDAFLVFYLLLAILANTYWNYYLGIICSSFLAMLTVAAHNYFHQKDNYRMYYFQFSLMSVREWRISHILSHHCYTNTITDLEISVLEPVLEFLPKPEKNSLKFYLTWLYYPMVCITNFHRIFINRWIDIAKNVEQIQWAELIPFTTPLLMYIFGGQTILLTLWMWTFITIAGSTIFFIVGLNAAHHHIDIFHDGDTPRNLENYDWGIAQLDAVIDRPEINKSHFLVLTNFGDHALHHLFPTLDHGILEMLSPTFDDVCKRFNVKLRLNSQLDMIKGSFWQLVRYSPNPNPPNLFKKYL